MTHVRMEGYVFVLYKEKYYSSENRKHCETHGINGSNLLQNKQHYSSERETPANRYFYMERRPEKSRTFPNRNRVRVGENPPTHKTITKSLNTSVTTINQIINQDLQLKKS